MELDGSGALVVGSTGDSGTPPVEPTEGVNGSGVGTGIGEGEGVGVTTGATDSTLDTDGVGSGAGLEVVGRTGSEGTPFVEPTSTLDEGKGVSGMGVTGTGTGITSSALERGEGETTTVSTTSEEVGAGLKCSSDSKNPDISADRSSADDCAGSSVELEGKGSSGVGSGAVTGSVVLANCRLTCRGK